MGTRLHPEIEYYCESQTIDDINLQKDRVSLTTIGLIESKNLEAKELLLIRSGGLGDLIMMLPVFLELSKTKEITISTFKNFQWIFKPYPQINIADYPIERKVIDSYEGYCLLKNLGEGQIGAHCQEKLCQLFNLPFPMQPEFISLSKEAMLQAYPKTKKRLAISTHSSSWHKDWPLDNFARVGNTFRNKDIEVVFLGDKALKYDNIKNVLDLTGKLSWEDQTGVLASSDVHLGNDSGNVHLSGALNINTIALYGPFRWQDHTSIYKSVKALQGYARCAPCGARLTTIKPKPDNCLADKHCKAMESIEVDRVIKEIKRLL